MKQQGGEGSDRYMNNESDQKLEQHGGEWKEDIKTGITRASSVKHTNDYPGYKGPGESF